MSEALLVMVGGAFGALSRYLLIALSVQVFGIGFPAGTLIINVSGSFVLGLLLALTSSTNLRLLLGTGFCGGYTTFSTFSVEAVNLLEESSPILAFVYVIGNVAGGLVAGWLGFLIGRNLFTA